MPKPPFAVRKDERIYIRATQTQKQEDKILLSEQDFDLFVTLIDTPPPPTGNLRRLMAEYDSHKLAHPEANL